MKFGIFYELIALKPHDNAAVIRAYKEAMEQIKFAEQMGFEYVWETEHHFLEKFSYSAAPELFLTAVAQNTSKIRIGHGAVLLTMNHPVRVAERAAVLDILSDGRLEFGTARGVTEAELGGFMIEPEDSRPMWEEALRMIPPMWMNDTFEWNGRFFKVPPRNVIPKPVQQPHPPLWIGGSGRRRTLRITAQYADAWNGGGSPEEVADLGQVLDQHCADVGRDPSEILRCAQVRPRDDADLLSQVEQYARIGVGEVIVILPPERAVARAEEVARLLPRLRGIG